MPSPFPGMDPYLEGPAWRSVHTLLATEIARSLAPRLLPRYVVLPEKVYVFAAPDRPDDRRPRRPAANRQPDVSIAEGDLAGAGPAAGGVAVLDAPLHVAVAMPAAEPEPQLTVEIRDADDQSLVTAIEILSTTNKRGDSRNDYLAKRNRLLVSDSHLMEIDLLRAGRRVPMADPLPDVPYFVILSRADHRPWADVWPITLRVPLPVVPVPLRHGDPDVSLDLQAILTTIYDLFGFAVSIDYRQPPANPLTFDDAAWAAALLAGRLQ